MQNMQEGGVLAVKIRKEMLGALGQAQHGAKMRHLGGRLLNGSILLAQQLQIADFLRRKTLSHSGTPPFF